MPEQRAGHFGEYEAGLRLSEIKNDALEMWFNLDNLPGVPELDLLLYYPEIGFFLIEIKSFKVDEIEQVKNGELILESKGKKDSQLPNIVRPLSQIRRAQVAFVNYLKNIQSLNKKDKERPYPFIQTSILFPRILKENWLKKFNQNENIELAKKIMFLDDINSDYSIQWKLNSLRNYPLLGVNPTNTKDLKEKMNFVRSAIKSSVFTNIEESKKVDLLKSNVEYSEKYATKFPFSRKNTIHIFKGAPGTGKTTILRQIALNHAKEGAAVLYLCYQKVLAAEQRREIELLREKNDKKGFVDVSDLYDFFKKYNNKINASLSSDDILELLLESQEFKNLEYETILVDEAQDLQNVAFSMLKFISKSDSSIYVSYGEGQEVFKKPDETSPPSWLKKQLENTNNVTTLRRSFRNATLPFTIAQSFWENALDEEKNNKWINKIFDSKPTPNLLLPIEFEIPNHLQEFKIEYCPFKEVQKEILYRIILEEYKKLEQKNKKNDLLIIVGNNKHSLQDVHYVLGKLSYEYKDLTLEENKRTPTDLIKITTQINSRGLTAETVILLDFEQTYNWIEQKRIYFEQTLNLINKDNKSNFEFNVKINNLGYICLSRAKSKTIVLINTSLQNIATNFLINSYYKLTPLIN